MRTSWPARRPRSGALAPSSLMVHRTARPARLSQQKPPTRPQPAAVAESSSSQSSGPFRCRWSCAGASNRYPLHPQRGLADAYRHALAVLAAGADTGVQRQIVADHRNAVQVGRAVADQHRALERRAHLAVLDLVRLGALEHVLPGRDVDLTAAEIGSIDAVLDRGEDFGGVALPGEHVGVGHAWHRHVRIALATAVAGRFHVHQPGVLAILHVADEDTVLDQDSAVGRRALIVDRQGTTP